MPSARSNEAIDTLRTYTEGTGSGPASCWVRAAELDFVTILP